MKVWQGWKLACVSDDQQPAYVNRVMRPDGQRSTKHILGSFQTLVATKWGTMPFTFQARCQKLSVILAEFGLPQPGSAWKTGRVNSVEAYFYSRRQAT